MKGIILSFIIVVLCSAQNNSVVHKESFYSEVPFEVENSRIYIKVFVNDKPFRFLFDTGASGYGRLDSAVVKELQIPITGTSSNSDGVNVRRIDNVEVKNIRFGKIKLEEITLLSRDYNRSRKKGEKLTNGIIGRRFWENYTLTINNERKRLIFTDKPLSLNDKNTVQYERPFEIPVEVGEVKTVGSIDMGSNLVMHFPMKYTKSGKVSELVKAGEGFRANTVFYLWEGEFTDPIKILGNTENNLKVLFSEKARRVNIGMGLLKNYNLSFDQKNRLVKLRKFTDND